MHVIFKLYFSNHHFLHKYLGLRKGNDLQSCNLPSFRLLFQRSVSFGRPLTQQVPCQVKLRWWMPTRPGQRLKRIWHQTVIHHLILRNWVSLGKNHLLEIWCVAKKFANKDVNTWIALSKFPCFLVCSHGQWLKRLQKILQWFLRWWFQSEAKSFHVQRKLYNRPSLSRYSSGDWRRFGLVVRHESQTQTSWINIRKTNHRTWPSPFARFFDFPS